MQSNEKDIALINALVTHFYEVVPHEFKTFCSLTSRICQSVLRYFGIEAELQPCQIWLVTDDHNYVVGFLGKAVPQKWDGHVVCRAGGFIVDAALKHFEKEFGLSVPSVVVTPCFEVPSQVISRCDLAPGTRFWWHYPPVSPGLDLNVPEEPAETVANYALQLVGHLNKVFAGTQQGSHAPFRDTTMGSVQ